MGEKKRIIIAEDHTIARNRLGWMPCPANGGILAGLETHNYPLDNLQKRDSL